MQSLLGKILNWKIYAESFYIAIFTAKLANAEEIREEKRTSQILVKVSTFDQYYMNTKKIVEG